MTRKLVLHALMVLSLAGAPAATALAVTDNGNGCGCTPCFPPN